MIKRKKTKKVKVGKVCIGGKAPVVIQSMTNTPTLDYQKTIKQIRALEKAGCEIVRVAVLNKKEIPSLKKIVQRAAVPVVADIHFHYKLALAAIECGVAKIRLNPGNIYKEKEVKEVVSAAKMNKVPIRIGANSGSVKNPKAVFSTPQIMVNSVLDYLKIFKKMKFEDIVISLKCSSVPETVKAYQSMSQKCNYPLHLGITAAGETNIGSLKSAIGIGSLLLQGIGDTIRVSLTGNPEEEVRVARQILQALDIRTFGPTLISCPTCGRCKVDLISIVKRLSKELKEVNTPLKIAVMGCVVNGPGEAKEVDMGIASGEGQGVLFKKGKIIKKLKEKDYVKVLLKEIKNIK